MTQEMVGKDGGPIEIADLSPLEAARRIAFSLRRAGAFWRGHSMSGLEMAASGLLAASSAAGTLMSANEEADALHAGRFNQFLTGVYRSQDLKRAADEQRAAGQRKAFELGRNKDLTLSTARARAAASGGGAQDTSVVNTMAGIEAQGEFQKAMARACAPEVEARELETASQNALIGAVN